MLKRDFWSAPSQIACRICSSSFLLEFLQRCLSSTFAPMISPRLGQPVDWIKMQGHEGAGDCALLALAVRFSYEFDPFFRLVVIHLRRIKLLSGNSYTGSAG